MKTIKQEIYFPVIVFIHFLFWAIDLYFYEGSFKEVRSEITFGPDLVDVAWKNPYRILGEVFSSWVVTVFAFNFLMATRAKWLEKIFGGLDKMYMVHRRSGTIAVILMLAHVFVVPKEVSFHIGKPLGAAAFFLILFGVLLAALPVFKRKIPYHKWINIHKLMGLFYVIAIAHAVSVKSLILELPITRVYVFGMALIGILAWVYRAFFYNIVNKKLNYNIKKITDLGNGITELILQPESIALSFTAGQFAFFNFPSISKKEQHPFTISSHPDDNNLRLSIKGLGDYTNNLTEKLNVGEKAIVEGPFGYFTQKQAKNNAQIWIAGGIGITPFLALAKELSNQKVALFWSVNKIEDAVYSKELDTIAKANPNFSFEIWATSEKGYIDIDKLNIDHFTNQDYFICGPQGIKSSLFKQLKSKDVKSTNMHDEEFAFR